MNRVAEILEARALLRSNERRVGKKVGYVTELIMQWAETSTPLNTSNLPGYPSNRNHLSPQCRSCTYYDSNKYLHCAVNPQGLLPGESCGDFEKRKD